MAKFSTYTEDSGPATADSVLTYEASSGQTKRVLLSAIKSLFLGTNAPTRNIVPSGALMPYAGITAPSDWLLCYGQQISRTTYEDLFNALVPSIGTFTVTIATPGVFTLASHGLNTGDSVYLTTTGALPTGLTANTLYYVEKASADTFYLATSRANAYAGTRIATSGSQSGTHTLRACPYGLGNGSTTFNVPDLRGRTIAGEDYMGGTAASRLALGHASGSYGNLGAAGGAQTHALVAAENGPHTHTVAARDADDAGTNAAVRGTDAGVTFNTGSSGSGTAHNNVQPTLVSKYIIKT